jgi:RND family efflux transporter MFP subunit
MLAIAGAGCNRSAPSTTHASPAKVQAPVKEAELTTITLTPEAEKRLGIETAVIAMQNVARTRSLGGEVVVIPGASVKVAAPVAGTLQAEGVPPPGTLLRRGQRVFRLIALAPAERDASIEAEREVDDARARVDAATKKAVRAEQLLKDGAGSRRAFEEAQTELEVARAALKAAESRSALVRRGPIASGGMDISSPLTGTLLSVAASPGQTVAASAPLFEVARVDPVWIRVPLYAGDVTIVDPRQPAVISGLGDEAQGTPRTGRRTAAPPSANPDAASVDIFYEVPNADGALKPGQRVTVRLPLQGSTSALALPKAALLHDASGGTWVYEVRGNHAYARRRVDVADIVGDLAVIARGPAAGTRIVTAGAAELFGTEFGIGK